MKCGAIAPFDFKGERVMKNQSHHMIVLIALLIIGLVTACEDSKMTAQEKAVIDKCIDQGKMKLKMSELGILNEAITKNPDAMAYYKKQSELKKNQISSSGTKGPGSTPKPHPSSNGFPFPK